MSKGNKKFFILLTIFVLFSCPLLFGEDEPEVSDTIINPSEVYIPKEDLSEDFQNENSETLEDDVSNKPNLHSEKSNKLEFRDLEQLQRLDKSRSTNNSLHGKELQYPQYLRSKKSSFEHPNMNDSRPRTNVDELNLELKTMRIK